MCTTSAGISRVLRSTGKRSEPLLNRRLKIIGACAPMVRPRWTKVAAKAVAFSGQPGTQHAAIAISGHPANQHALADLCTGAVGPALGQPGQELEASVPAVIDPILSSRLVERVRCIREEDLLLLSQRQTGPHHADEDIGESDQLLPGQRAQPVELGDTLTLTAEQRSLHPSHGRMRRRIAATQQALCAPRAGCG